MNPLVVVALTAVIQSTFGVGVLLFGTPWLLLMGVGFSDALWTLLPVSLTISLLQVGRGWNDIEWSTVREIIRWTLPFVALALWLTTLMKLPIEILVALLVLAVAAMDRSVRLRSAIEGLLRRRRSYLALMGLVHGTSNLGGSLLTALIYASFRSREAARATIAAGYALFAAIQLLVLAFGPTQALAWRATLLGILTGTVVFIVVERATAGRIDGSRYRLGLSVLLMCTGCVLLGRALL